MGEDGRNGRDVGMLRSPKIRDSRTDRARGKEYE